MLKSIECLFSFQVDILLVVGMMSNFLLKPGHSVSACLLRHCSSSERGDNASLLPGGHGSLVFVDNLEVGFPHYSWVGRWELQLPTQPSLIPPAGKERGDFLLPVRVEV